MGLFEQYPFVLVPVILVTVAGYDCAKWLIRRGLEHRNIRVRL